MIKIENVEVVGWEAAIRGMRNPMNSWDKSDSYYLGFDPISNKIPHIVSKFQIGSNDHQLMTKLAAAGPVHAKYRRMIAVYVDITAPLYWWKEFDTYKVGTIANSCSTMHKIAENEFTWEDFSTEHLIPCRDCSLGDIGPTLVMDTVIHALNTYRKKYLETREKKYWWQMIQLLPSSYNQKRTIMLNYEVLAGIYPMRKDHKLDEWVEFCRWIEELPYSEIITGDESSSVVDKICETGCPNVFSAEEIKAAMTEEGSDKQ